MFRVSGKGQGGSAQESWYPGVWQRKDVAHRRASHMKEDGLVVQSRAARELPTIVHVMCFWGRGEPRAVAHRPTDVSPEEQESPQPRHKKVMGDLVEAFGGFAGCPKCRAIASGDPGYEIVGHSARCLGHIEDLVKKDKVLKERLEVAEEHHLRYMAAYIEKKDRKRARTETPSGLAGA